MQRWQWIAGVLLVGLAWLGCAAAQATTALDVSGYARETPPGATMSAAYLSLRNSGKAPRRLVAVTLPDRDGAAAALHTTVVDDGINRMRPLAQLAIPAGATVAMAPGGVHLMLRGVRLQAGEQLSLRLHFANGSERNIRVPVRGPQGGGHKHG
ncbi:copper chaperone PCu(A)C [Microbulbifer sp. SAOS-129_SWC]|uniref:copper chaperone PCu(A)C n=1 Tax=Microbulbifer sp. SAOS-129_SWC TaxID=3145235 RepID=UPI003217FA2B